MGEEFFGFVLSGDFVPNRDDAFEPSLTLIFVVTGQAVLRLSGASTGAPVFPQPVRISSRGRLG